MISTTIVIPIFNPDLVEFNLLLRRLNEQIFDKPYEVIVINSYTHTSKDYIDLINLIQSSFVFSIRFFNIKKDYFNHGLTRKFGALASKGDFVVFITQDALPKDNLWLQSLIDPFSIDSSIVGVFGKHVAKDDASYYTKKRLNQHFNNFGQDIKIQFCDDPDAYKSNVYYRMSIGFFSDNNSAIRLDYFKKHPYTYTNFAEDQLWADQLIANGYKKVYTPFAVVFHSHEYSLFEQYNRSFEEFYALFSIYNYKHVYTFIDLFRKIVQTFFTNFKEYYKIKRGKRNMNLDFFEVCCQSVKDCIQLIAAYDAGRFSSLCDSKKMKIKRKTGIKYI